MTASARPSPHDRPDVSGPVAPVARFPTPTARPKPTIELVEGELSATLESAWRALSLLPDDDRIYLRGRQPVRISRIEAGDRGAHRAVDALALRPACASDIIVALDRAASFVRFDARSRTFRATDPPRQLAALMVETADGAGLLQLAGLIEAPTIDEAGDLIDEPGYHAASGLYYRPVGAGYFPPVDASPSEADAAQALDYIEDLFRDFPFVDHGDSDGSTSRAVALAAAMTAVLRPGLATAPAFGFDATAPGSGKSLCQDLVAILATGRPAEAITHTADPAEERKKIFAMLLEGAPVLSIDNVEGPLGSELLCSVLTARTLRDRVLGASTTVAVPTAATLTVSGNNLQVRGDLSRRILVARLDPRCERPDERTFDRDLRAYALDHRPHLVAAALTVARAYIARGEPLAGELKPFGSFETWSRRVREPLVWLGRPDPLGNRSMVESNDPTRDVAVAVLAAWRGAFGARPATVAEAMRADDAELRSALDLVPSKSGRPTAHAIGNWLRRNRGRVWRLPDGERLALVAAGHDPTTKAATWFVEVQS